MKRPSPSFSVTLLTGIWFLCASSSSIAQSQNDARPTPEAEALNSINLATNPTTKLAAAEEFVSKFPKSPARQKVAELVAEEIKKVRQAATAIVLIERAKKVFPSEDEWVFFRPIELAAYADGNRVDDAFKVAAEILAKNPDDVFVLTKMTVAGAEEAKKRNRKYLSISLDYGNKAIRLIESDNTTALSEKNERLSLLYQQTAILLIANAELDQATERLSRAIQLRPADPGNYALKGRLLQTSYTKKIESADANPNQRELDPLLDEIIENYARAAGLAKGKAEYQVMLQQVIPDLTNFYKVRYRGSTSGLQQLLEKYRRPQ